METSSKINILIGEEAVKEFEVNGAEGCSRNGHMDVDSVEYDEDTNPEDLVRQVLAKTSGSLAAIVISQEDADAILGE